MSVNSSKQTELTLTTLAGCCRCSAGLRSRDFLGRHRRSTFHFGKPPTLGWAADYSTQPLGQTHFCGLGPHTGMSLSQCHQCKQTFRVLRLDGNSGHAHRRCTLGCWGMSSADRVFLMTLVTFVTRA